MNHQMAHVVTHTRWLVRFTILPQRLLSLLWLCSLLCFLSPSLLLLHSFMSGIPFPLTKRPPSPWLVVCLCFYFFLWLFLVFPFTFPFPRWPNQCLLLMNSEPWTFSHFVSKTFLQVKLFSLSIFSFFDFVFSSNF